MAWSDALDLQYTVFHGSGQRQMQYNRLPPARVSSSAFPKSHDGHSRCHHLNLSVRHLRWSFPMYSSRGS